MKASTWLAALTFVVLSGGTALAGASDGQNLAKDPCSLDPWCADGDEDGVPDAADPCPSDAEDLCTQEHVG